MATHSSVLAWRIPGAAEPGGLPSMGSHRVGHDWRDLAVRYMLLILFLILHFRKLNPREIEGLLKNIQLEMAWSVSMPNLGSESLNHMLPIHSRKCNGLTNVDINSKVWVCLWGPRGQDKAPLPWDTVFILSMTRLVVPIRKQLWVITVNTSDQIKSVAQSHPTLCGPMNRSTPGLPVHHQLPEFTQTHVYRVSDAIQPSHPLSSPSPPAPNPSQHQSLFQWANSSHEVAKVLEFQL